MVRSGMRDGNASRAGFSPGNIFGAAEFAEAVEMADEVERPGFAADESGNCGIPNGQCFGTCGWGIGAFFGEIEADGADVGAKIQRLDQQSKRGARLRV